MDANILRNQEVDPALIDEYIDKNKVLVDVEELRTLQFIKTLFMVTKRG